MLNLKAKTAVQSFDCLSVERGRTLASVLKLPIRRIAANQRAHRGAQSVPSCSTNKQAKFCVAVSASSFLTTYLLLFLLIFFVNSLNPQTKFTV